jgi:hypothetical protein
MPGLFSRVKTFVFEEIAKSSEVNAEFDNIIANLVPAKLDDYSTNITQMQIQTDQIKDRWGDFRTLILPETAENGNRIVYAADIKLDSVKNRIQLSETESIQTSVLVFSALTLFFIFLKIRPKKNFLPGDYFSLKYLLIFIIIFI